MSSPDPGMCAMRRDLNERTAPRCVIRRNTGGFWLVFASAGVVDFRWEQTAVTYEIGVGEKPCVSGRLLRKTLRLSWNLH